jgi:hypothetical protein
MSTYLGTTLEPSRLGNTSWFLYFPVGILIPSPRATFPFLALLGSRIHQRPPTVMSPIPPLSICSRVPVALMGIGSPQLPPVRYGTEI